MEAISSSLSLGRRSTDDPGVFSRVAMGLSWTRKALPIVIGCGDFDHVDDLLPGRME